MSQGHSRFYIELYHPTERARSRKEETDERKARADRFAESLRHWLAETGQSHLITGLTVTALGQIELLCDPYIIDQIRGQDVDGIAAIRASRDMGVHSGRTKESRA